MDFLKELGIKKENYGACIGGEDWINTSAGQKLDSINPATGDVIASVFQATGADYEEIIKTI